ncbi:auxin-responsive protein SAUR76-like [Miscanthus floridulus]|uniref:auxin-responsive protein SAUR76-like n=1 Tax=Miscanthus floridulus TaxID=154761 RepID=UPI0034577754
MAKGGLSKLRCMIKRWHSSSRIVSRAPSPSAHDGDDHDGAIAGDARARGASFHGADEVPKGLHPVYVGKSRRRYLIAEELVGHPLFQTLVHRTGGGGATGGAAAAGTVVGCEVVLFEHLLWMLENADPQPESLNELVDYYAC